MDNGRKADAAVLMSQINLINQKKKKEDLSEIENVYYYVARFWCQAVSFLGALINLCWF